MEREELVQDLVDAEKVLEHDRVALAHAAEWVKQSEKRVEEAKRALEDFDDPRSIWEKIRDIEWENYLERTTKN